MNEDLENKTELLIPAQDCPKPLITLLIPAMNEAITIGRFIDWCMEGFKNADVQGEVLIVDSSTDETPQIALAKGARVLRYKEKGLGAAYIAGLPYVRGQFIIMGDCDCTYDFREIRPFLTEFRKGSEFVMGSRFKGSIEKDAMPALHKYFGTPLTTWLLNFIYGCKFSDIHCGMRGMTVDACRRLHLQSRNWEYASEMIIKAVNLGMKHSEVPIRFHKDPKGRVSHLKRLGWTAPWIAGWQTLRIFFIYRPSFFLRKPGYLFSIVGFLLILILTAGPIQMGGLSLSLHSQIMGLFFLCLGLGLLQLDSLTTSVLQFEHRRLEKLHKFFDYNRIVPVSIVLMLSGFCFKFLPFMIDWIRTGFRLNGLSHSLITSLGVMLLGFYLFIQSLTFAVLKQKAELSQ